MTTIPENSQFRVLINVNEKQEEVIDALLTKINITIDKKLKDLHRWLEITMPKYKNKCGRNSE